MLTLETLFKDENDNGWDEISLEKAINHAELIEIGSRRCIGGARNYRSTIVALLRELKKQATSS